jgi:hypothetical protein
MESKNESVQNLFLSFFKQNKSTDTQKEIDAVILIQRWWRENQWKRFYTIPNERIDTDVISTECNIGDHYQFSVKRKFDETETDNEADDEREDEETGGSAKLGWFGYKKSTGQFTFYQDTPDTSDNPDTLDSSDISDAKSDYEDEIDEDECDKCECDKCECDKCEHLINRYENLVVNHNNFINDFFTSFFTFMYRGFKFMLGF